MPELGKSGSAGGPGRATAQVYPPPDAYSSAGLIGRVGGGRDLGDDPQAERLSLEAHELFTAVGADQYLTSI
jgi:hypothetical protein